MASISESIQAGLAHQQAGRLHQAERLYRQVLEVDPGHAGAMHLLGLIALQAGQPEAAVDRISHAIRSDGTQAAFHANLGEAFRLQGKLAEAEASYRQALRLNPKLAEAHNNLGTILQVRGRLDEAVVCFQQALANRPDYADALNNLGTIWQERCQWHSAIEWHRRAVAAAPNYANGYYNLAVSLREIGELAESARAFSRAIALENKYAMAHYGLATVYEQEKRLAEAESAYRRAVFLEPRLADAWIALGVLLQAKGLLAESIVCYQAALRAQPDYGEAYYNWGNALVDQGHVEEALGRFQLALSLRPEFVPAHYNLGLAFHHLGRLEEAAAAYLEALRLKPDDALAHNNLGNVYKEQGKKDQAVASYEQSLSANDRNSAAFNNLGYILSERDQLAKAIRCYQRAIHCDRQCVEAYCNLGNVLSQCSQKLKALACYDKCLRIDPNSADGHWNRALLLLAHEDFVRGWPDYTWLPKTKAYPPMPFKQPLWDGSEFVGRTLLIHAEQGLGDTFQFVRYLELARQRGGTVLFAAQDALVPLLESSGITNVVPAGRPLPPFDLFQPLLQLPAIFGTTLDTMPAQVPYLAPDDRLTAKWHKKMAEYDGFKIGISWQGNPSFEQDRQRSVELKEFEPLARIDSVRLFSLQKKDGLTQLAALGDRFAVHELGSQLDNEEGAFMDTAAVMKNLDLVIGSDSATIHLAGALGVKVWVALSQVPDWRWFLRRADSPWYPTMRLFRQTSRGDWRDVFRRMAAELASIVNS